MQLVYLCLLLLLFPGSVSLRAEEAGKIPAPPIPIRFTLKDAGYVTLVIERPDGFRVRNLISETHFPAGENTAWWDGTDDLGRDEDAAMHGLYHIPGKFVEPGPYIVRGLVHGEITPRYEFSVYTTGNPPWNTPDNTGAWLANHSAPQAAAFVPAEKSPAGVPVVYLGCYVTEGPSGVAWVDLDGKKLGGKKWVGGIWTAAPYLAVDRGSKAAPDVYAYVGSVWKTALDKTRAELRLTVLAKSDKKAFLIYPLDTFDPATGCPGELGGIAVRDGVLVASLTAKNQLLFVDAVGGKVIGTAAVTAPRGIAFDSKGRLLVLSGTTLVRFASVEDPAKMPAPETIIASGLEAPVGLTLDDTDSIFVSDQGKSNQVKIFTEDGKPASMIGQPGPSKAGPYDPLHMNHPAGLAVDSKQQLWVTECDFLPKRVSVWSLQGKLLRAFYGPAKYGGGGTIDPQDPSKFYYADEGRGAMEFKLDWKAGSYELKDVYYRRDGDGMKLPKESAAPETPLYFQGRRYFTNAYNSSPTSGASLAFLFADQEGGVVRPVAGMGRTSDWELLGEDAFKSRWPEGSNPGKSDAFFTWSDLNENGQVEPEEVSITKAKASGITVMNDLSFCVAHFEDQTLQFSPVSMSKSGVPHYDISSKKVLASEVKGPASSGGNQALVFDNGWTALTLGLGPFSKFSIGGAKDGVAKWSYPSPWPGLHAGHRAPRPDRNGQLIGTTRLAGGPFDVKGSDAGPFWALHSNMGRMAVFTSDGLFVANIFEDMRVGQLWRMPTATRGMSLAGVTLGEENFWPTVTATPDGKVYLVDGSRSAIVLLDGVETTQRLPDSHLTVDKADLEKCRSWQAEAEAARQRETGTGVLKVALRSAAPVVDGKLDDWADAAWVDIDKRGTKANFNADTKPYDIEAAVAVAGDRLYVAWKTGDAKLLLNSGEMPVALFKSGGALDVMISTNPGADANRREPVEGDQRLLVTLVGGKPRALLYRAVVPGTKDADKVPFSSPWRTITLDRVDDVSSQIEYAGADGNAEISIPLTALGLKPEDGLKLKGDVGILRGNGTETTARVYWNNKATSIVSDVPDEAILTPNLWGTWEFKR